MQKTTVRVSSDTALVKYWGKKDEVLRLPENGSIAIKLAGLDTTTTVEWDEKLKQDEVMIEGNMAVGKELDRVVKHLQRIRYMADKNIYAKVSSINSFPKGTGLSSSGSGFAALTIAATKAIGLSLTEKELSILARQGSGSACRDVCGGFVEWRDGDTSESSYSETIFPASHWDIRDVVVVVDEGMKKISSTEGHMSAQSSPMFEERQRRIGNKIARVKELIGKRDFEKLGYEVEKEALEFHSVLLTSEPPMIAWYPGTIEVMLAVQKLRDNGVLAFFTINTGFNVHVLTLPEYEKRVEKEMRSLSLVKNVLLAKVDGKPKFINEHLF